MPNLLESLFLTWPQILAVSEEALIEPPQIPVEGAAQANHTIIDLVTGSGPVVQFCLLILVITSIVTWGIIGAKFLQLRKARKQTRQFSSVFWGSRNLSQISESSQKLEASPVASVYAAGHKELTHIIRAQDKGSGGVSGGTGDFGNVESIDRALKRAKTSEINRLESGTTFLATTASAAPFVGLFGTVWGVMNAFIGLSQAQTSSIQAVAPGISEALISTAIGLAAAIPATIAYNYISTQVRVLSRQMDIFSAEFLNIARRHFL